MKVRTLAAVAALALGAAIGGGAAQAATYYLAVDGCSGAGGCLGSNTQVGTVNVTASGGVLSFDISLDNGAVFNSAGNSSQHNAFVFDLNPGGATVTNLTDFNFTTVNSSNVTVTTTDFAQETGGPFSDAPFGNAWNNAIAYVGSAHQGGAENNFSFQVKDDLNNLSLSMLTFGATYNGSHIMFASDVYANGNTGNVGAYAGGGIPEPATWGLMIMGVACIGAAMRQQRAKALAAA
jgi:hypothetical protein